MQTELSGIAAFGRAALVYDGAGKTLATSKVKIPDDDTLNCVTGVPLKEKVNGMVWLAVHTGEAFGGVLTVTHPAGNPPPTGYSASMFNPPGLVPAFTLA